MKRIGSRERSSRAFVDSVLLCPMPLRPNLRELNNKSCFQALAENTAFLIYYFSKDSVCSKARKFGRLWQQLHPKVLEMHGVQPAGEVPRPKPSRILQKRRSLAVEYNTGFSGCACQRSDKRGYTAC